MDPVTIVLWICVVVFGATSVIAILYLAGIVTGPYGKILIGTLVTQIVLAGCSAFAYEMNRPKSDAVLPITKLMIVEQANRLIVYDGGTPIYLRSTDVSRANRFADLVADVREDCTSAASVRLKPGAAQTVSIGSKKYRLGFSQMGQLDADPKETQAPTGDFVLLSIERER